MKEFKPIAMKCNQEQFNAIKPILKANGGRISCIQIFNTTPYLVNNLDSIQMCISNVSDSRIDENGRTVFEEWNQDTFLEYCGIEVEPKFRPIAMKCNKEQFNSIKPILEANSYKFSTIYLFSVAPYLVNNINGEKGIISNTDEHRKDSMRRNVFEEWNQDIFLEYCGIKPEKQTNMGYKLTVPATDVLAIHKIACSNWKNIISKYLTRVDSEQNIKFTEEEVDDMFEAATEGQKPVLIRIFGEKKKEIDYTKLKTGSIVMIKDSNRHCGGFGNINKDKPVDIVFYKTPHFVTSSGKFETIGHYDQYITFHQKGEFVLFTAHEEIDYITEVIEY